MKAKDKKKFFEEIKGIKRVVINSTHGGFGLSDAGVKRYLELQGIECWPSADSKLGHKTWWLVPPGPERMDREMGADTWKSMTLSERQAHNNLYNRQVFRDRKIDRDDPYLIKVVQELGSAASGKYADLKIVEFPDDVNWYIEEYDGIEWVAEQHRTWR